MRTFSPYFKQFFHRPNRGRKLGLSRVSGLALGRWAPAVEDTVTICETILTATTSWLSFVVGALGIWAPAIEDIVAVSETVLTVTTVWSGHGSDSF